MSRDFTLEKYGELVRDTLGKPLEEKIKNTDALIEIVKSGKYPRLMGNARPGGGADGDKMRVLFDMGHPAHMHFFKNTIWELEKHGHQVKVTARGNCTFNTFAQPPITPL
ncbi:MAG: hypothetical protein Q7J68_00340 [Thermoplasmata archaeon]|nr:hypothetical protein [Thermoplasmata archaeon]